jgi:hypothetical protein
VVAIPTLAPRNPKCRICTGLVADPNDVTMRLYDRDLTPQPPKAAVDYLRACGAAGSDRQIRGYVLVHRRHVDEFIARDGAVAPGDNRTDVSRIPTLAGDANWLDVNRQGMRLGEEANRLIMARLPDLDDKHLVAVAKLGQNAATTRATLEIKGAIKRAESIARIASGLQRPEAE